MMDHKAPHSHSRAEIFAWPFNFNIHNNCVCLVPLLQTLTIQFCFSRTKSILRPVVLMSGVLGFHFKGTLLLEICTLHTQPSQLLQDSRIGLSVNLVYPGP